MKAKSLQPLLRWAVVLTASLILMCSARAASKYKVLHDFGDRPAMTPLGELVADSSGNLYGTTSSSSNGCGVVFKLTKAGSAWSYTVIHRFHGADGKEPTGRLIFDSSGNLYGATLYGGTASQGTVFELSPLSGGTWKESVLASLGVTPNDVQLPLGGLTLDANGNLFGIALRGQGTSNYGGAFEVERSGNQWKEKVIHSFNSTDGAYPRAGDLVWDTAGNLYGTTTFGGSYGNGVVFELSPSSGAWTETVLHTFDNLDGIYPEAGLVFDSSGNLYGTTSEGGNPGAGIVFQLTPSSGRWIYSGVFIFDWRGGGNPFAPLIFDSAGNLYGTTANGGAAGDGVVFELTQSGGQWSQKVLYNFDGKHGAQPSAGLIFDQQGILYGTASDGGLGGHPGYGAVFSLTP